MTREELIDHLEHLAEYVKYSEDAPALRGVIEMLTEEQLPSAQLAQQLDQKLAQPEIIRCKDCYWWTKQEDSLQGRCDRYGHYPTGAWFCASAKRREE